MIMVLFFCLFDSNNPSIVLDWIVVLLGMVVDGWTMICKQINWVGMK